MQHKTKTILNKNHKLNIFTQSWAPDNADDVKAIIFIIHGLGEHSSRYKYVAHKFVQNNYKVATIDLPGHGRTTGGNAYIRSFDLCLDIIDTQISEIKKETPQLPVVILGHSMGGALAVNYALKLKPQPAGFILSSAVLKISEDISPVLVKLSGLFGKLFPKLPTIKLDSQGLSHDPKVVEKYNNDPLVYSGKIPARTGAEINRSVKFNQARAAEFDYPVFMVHGNRDKLADFRGSEEFFVKISSRQKEIKIYDGLYHELMNEYEKDDVIKDIISWLDTLV